jgi:NCS2 family nucleobase:cation symporter-2
VRTHQVIERRRLLDRFGFAPRCTRVAPVPAGLTYGVADKPRFALTLFGGVQWTGLVSVYLIYLLIVVRQSKVPPPTIAAMVGLSMLALGLAALLQALPRGPVGSGYLAPAVLTANYLEPSIFAIKLGGLPMVFGMTLFAGCCEAALAPFVPRLKRLLPTEIQGLVVFLIGVVVGSIGFRLTFAINSRGPIGAAHLAVAALTFGTTVILTIWGRGALRMLALLIAMLLGYAVSIASGILNWSSLSVFGAIPLFALPRFNHIGFAFSPTLMLPFAAGAWASTAKAIGLLSQCQKLNDAEWREPDMHSLRRGVLADGLGSGLSGLFGTLGLNTVSSTAVVQVATGLASRRVAYATAGLLGALAFLPFFSVALALIPTPVIGGITLFVGALTMISGLQTVASCPLDQRRSVVVGLGLIAGLAVEKYPNMAVGLSVWVQALTASSVGLGTMVAIVANLLLPDRALQPTPAVGQQESVRANDAVLQTDR